MHSSDTTDWQQLRHAYGIAADIPPLLESAAGFPAEASWQSEPWYSLWSALYHQGDIYPASIAAVPELVSALAGDPGKATLSHYLLPASIAIADHATPVDVAPALRHRFDESLRVLGAIAAQQLPTLSDPGITRAAQAAVLVSTGAFEQAAELLEGGD